MDFDLSKLQQSLKTLVRDALRRHCTLERVRRSLPAEAPLDRELWQILADEGWLVMHLREAAGGLGMNLVDLVVVDEELGAGCVPGPLLATQWAAALVSEAFGPDRTAKWRMAEWIEAVLSGAKPAAVVADACAVTAEPTVRATAVDDGFLLEGSAQQVLGAAEAGLFVVPALRDDDWLVAVVPRDTRGLEIKPSHMIDPTRRWGEVRMSQVRVSNGEVVGLRGATRSAVIRSHQTAAVAALADTLGAMQWLLDATVEYAKTRQQFGRPIGVFQAVQHHAANMLLATESARSAIYYAAWALAEQQADADRALSIAKAYTSDAARLVANLAVQVHGGIGFTWEHDLHLYYKRLKVAEMLFGSADAHRELVAATLD